MVEHTPGPWKWDWRAENGIAHCGVFSEPNVGQAYAIARCPRYEARIQWEANARLIAAAPELLDALRGMRDLVKDSSGYSVIVKDLDKIIARAEGRSNV